MKIAQYESEAQRRAVELEAAVARLEAEAALRHDREYELARMARYDALTGLLNRRTFHELLAEILAAPGMAGAALLTISLLVNMNPASLVLEFFWSAIAIWGLVKAVRARRNTGRRA